MKKQLQELFKQNLGRLMLLTMIMFIGQGVVFAQGTLTVTTNADNGDGSLRQTIVNAVDGDVITFDGAITTIVLDSSLNLGDKTLTIDGGGAVVLHRERTSLDSFRLVTITGVSEKVVTLMDLTIEGGFANGERGGGLHADHSSAGGQTILSGIVFKNNKTNAEGGGASIEGYNIDTACVINNCQFIENEVLAGGDGDGGGIIADVALITGCTFTDNIADDDGGALWIREVYVYDSHIEGSVCGDAGGAVRIQSKEGTFINCTFDNNSSGGNGGAIFAAYGYIQNCKFMNNTATGSGGAVSANNNDWLVEDCMFMDNKSLDVGGSVYIDDGGTMTNSIITNSSAVNGGGVYIAGKKAPASMVGCVLANNMADSIGGGAYVAKGDIINCSFAGNYATDNGGGLSGDGTWSIKNSIVYGNDAAGANKNIQVVSNTGATAENCAIDATSYDAAAWTATNITTLSESPFVGGTAADSLMLPYSSALIDAGDTTGISALIPEMDPMGVNRVINGAIDLGAYERYNSSLVTTDADDGAGSLRQAIADATDGETIIRFADNITMIKVDTTLMLGDSSVIIDGGGDVILDGAFNGDMALDTLNVISITGAPGKVVTIMNLMIQNGYSEDGNGGAISSDHSAGGKTMIENVTFKDNTAYRNGGALYLIGDAANPSMVDNCTFTGNYVDNGSGEGDGGGMYAENAVVSECTFTDNEAMDDAGALYANDEVEILNSTFTGNIAGGAGGAIRTGDQSILISDCMFESNTTGPQGGGAIFMARGTVENSEFKDNTSGSSGGAIHTNNEPSDVYNSMFTGNSATTIGGAIYVDDGGMLSNIIVKKNTAGTDGGGIYLAGKKATPTLVGSVIADNTATANGGGVYVMAGNVINSILTMNTAGTNGGALTGSGGPWFIANTVVWANDATGADKNIEVVSNSATDHAANCAIDATAYNAAAWTATNITTLDASPFVGGTGADSLYFPTTSALIDAGTLDFGVEALLPEMDLDGADRIQGTVDIGVYETEIFSVLGVSLDQTVLTVSVGGTGTLTATIEPDFATDKSVTWSSSAESIATVDGGVVSGVAEGDAVITVTTVDGDFTATCNVTVVIAVTGVTLDQDAVSLAVDETVTLVATVAPDDATNPTVGWVSGNEDVATVDGGVVTAVSTGTAAISVVTLDGSFIAICQVTVIDPVAVTGVTLDQTSATIDIDATVQLTATVAPEDATDKTVTWTSSDDAVATVDATGLVTGVAKGTATITATTTDGGLTATAEITVNPPVSTNSISAKSFNVYPNPVQNNLFIEGENIHSVALYSVTGKSVMIVEEGFSKGINISAIESGLYFVKIKTDEGTAVKRIVKE